MPLNIELKLDLKLSDAFSENLALLIERGMRATAEGMKVRAKELSAVDTGKNRDSIDIEVNRKGDVIECRVFTESGYGGWLETGTGLYGPHKTRCVPVNAKALKWTDWKGHGDGPFYAMSTRGMPAQPFLFPAFTEYKDEWAINIREELSAYGKGGTK